ncbi:hypothetical protein FisN_9Hh076 [Fistulifera solaris]|jgi:hypothetical protein|uniref:HMG box domain-containing protein n=1 Tax=Fistulifera solaris TaxID=1519565 RepID=A0A1Z5K286_FISSO|nr:hypothetical protein FisN_9Hh076 [Fistulifera solaris]|eukprot:GAX20364.1 hypothetical protein FisN_9Hh076 [Fistulifera solaris]
MFKKTFKAINTATTEANAISPKTDTQVSSHSQSDEERRRVLHVGASTGQSNPSVQLPPYVYVPSSSKPDDSLPISQQGRQKDQRDDDIMSRRADVELTPQESFLRRPVLSGFPQMFPAPPMYHYPATYEERMLQHMQPQYIVVSPTFATRPTFMRPYDIPMPVANLAWLQQQQSIQSARLHVPELHPVRASPPRDDLQVTMREDTSILAADTAPKVAPENPREGPEPQASRVVVGDKPKRPLSAYNYFFKEEREKMIRVETGDGKKPQSARIKKKRHGIKFEDMAKAIAKKWNQIDPEALYKYEEMAQADKHRYKQAMQEYIARKNFALSAAHKELASTVSGETMQRYLKNQDQRATEHASKQK